MPLAILRIALGIGLAIDATIAFFALFIPAAMGPIFDIPLRDPAATSIAGGEFLVVSLVYFLLLRDPKGNRALLLLVALDQALAVLLPAYEIHRGNVAATWKTVAPIPFQALLSAAYLVAWRALGTVREYAPPP